MSLSASFVLIHNLGVVVISYYAVLGPRRLIPGGLADWRSLGSRRGRRAGPRVLRYTLLLIVDLLDKEAKP